MLFRSTEGCSYSDSYIFEVADCSHVLEAGARASVRIYPNPIQAGTALYFDDYMQRVSLSIFDASGRLVWSTSDAEGNVIPITASLPSGIYTLRGEAGAIHFTRLLVAE